MAILTSIELAEVRQNITINTAIIDYTKSVANAAVQAIEDFMEANRAAIGTAINTATAPYVFTPAMKKKLFAYWCRQKFSREGV